MDFLENLKIQSEILTFRQHDSSPVARPMSTVLQLSSKANFVKLSPPILFSLLTQIPQRQHTHLIQPLL